AEIMDADHVSDVVEDFRTETISALVMVHCPENTYPEQWDVEGLKASIGEVLDLDPPVDGWLKEEEVAQDILIERLGTLAAERMESKTAGVDRDGWVQFEKNLLIQRLDHHWKEHLATLDALRAVIHLRSYAQKKPIDEYKQEAFLLFERLLGAIREDVTRMLMRTQVQYQEPVQMAPASAFALPDFITHHIDPLSGDDDSADFDSGGSLLSNLPPLHAPMPAMPQGADGETIVAPESRNAPCPCGSGRKYKHCHGQAA
ncbi:MAG TPA: SEC-C metal-binding domain-containing protein, partial [Sphingomicrobium sp.]|nr:SEC-C metal-binding domain-containing protein [Sphingomicrobium sp.]